MKQSGMMDLTSYIGLNYSVLKVATLCAKLTILAALLLDLFFVSVASSTSWQ